MANKTHFVIDKEELKRLYNAGTQMKDIAQQLGCSEAVLFNNCTKMFKSGELVRRPRKKSEKSNLALDNVDRGKVMALFKAKRAIAWIAQDMGQSPEAISAVISAELKKQAAVDQAVEEAKPVEVSTNNIKRVDDTPKPKKPKVTLPEVKHEAKPTQAPEDIRYLDRMNELHEIYKRKNHDYGDSFAQLYKRFGLTYAVIHLAEKMNRLETLSKEPAQVQAESIEDTLKDMANYCILTLMEIDDAG